MPNNTAIVRLSKNLVKMIQEEQRRFEKDFGVKLSSVQISDMLASKFGPVPLKNVEIKFRWKNKRKNGLAINL